MFRLYSKACEYAIMALSNIPSADMDERFTVDGLCRQRHMRASYTRKAFQLLSQKGIFQAVTGPGGGYRFNKNPDKVTLLELILCIDGEECFDQCVLGLPLCQGRKPCPMHKTWGPLKKRVLNALKKITLGEIIRLNAKQKKEN